VQSSCLHFCTTLSATSVSNEGGAIAVDWLVGRVVLFVPALDEQECVYEVDLGGGLEADVLFAEEVELGAVLLVWWVIALAFRAEREPNVRLVETLFLHLTPQPLDPDLVRVLRMVLVVVATATQPVKEGKFRVILVRVLLEEYGFRLHCEIY